MKPMIKFDGIREFDRKMGNSEWPSRMHLCGDKNAEIIQLSITKILCAILLRKVLEGEDEARFEDGVDLLP